MKLEGVTGGYRGGKRDCRGLRWLQGVTRFTDGYRGFQGVPIGYKGLQGVTGDFKCLEGVRGVYKGLEGVTGRYKG